MKWKRPVEGILTLAGILLFISPSFSMLEWKYATFAGIACFLAIAVMERYID